MFSLPRLRPLVAALAGLTLAAGTTRADFALRDGDTVAFLGDSITAARGYTKTVELYTLLRFPERRVRFFNAGQGGDTAAGAVGRLERDVFSHGATVVTVAFGINDIAWGTKADATHKKAYLDGIRTVVEQCRAHGARVFVCSPAITDVPPDEAEKGFLQSMTDEGLALAKSLGAEAIDVQRGMRAVQRRILEAEKDQKDPAKRTRLHVADGVHLNDLGHLSMAYTLLKGLGAPAEVSAVTLDAAQPATPAGAQGCTASEVKKREDGGVEFTRLDKGLPLNLGSLGALNYRWIPIPDGLDQYRLTIKNLPPGDYEITVEGRPLGRENAGALAAGTNLCSKTANGWEPGGPWEAQAFVVKGLVNARNELEGAEGERRRFLANGPQAAALDGAAKEAENKLVDLQRATARPYPYHFVVRPVK